MQDVSSSNAPIVVNKGRQTGTSTAFILAALWICTFKPITHVKFSTPTLQMTESVMEKFKRVYASLPDWMQQTKVADNHESIKFINGSSFDRFKQTDDCCSRNTVVFADEAGQNNKFAGKVARDVFESIRLIVSTNSIRSEHNSYKTLKYMWEDPCVINFKVPNMDTEFEDVESYYMDKNQFMTEYRAIIDSERR